MSAHATNDIARKIIKLVQPWEKELPHCSAGKPLYSSEEYTKYYEEQQYIFQEGDFFFLVKFERNIQAPTDRIWGMHDGMPDCYVSLFKDGKFWHTLKQETITALSRFVNRAVDNKPFEFQIKERVVIRENNKPVFCTIQAVKNITKEDEVEYQLKSDYATYFVYGDEITKEDDYQPEDYVDKDLVETLMLALTCRSQFYEGMENQFQQESHEALRKRSVKFFVEKFLKDS